MPHGVWSDGDMLSTTLTRRLSELDRLTNGRLGSVLIDGRQAGKSYDTLALEVHAAFGVQASGPTIQRWHAAYLERAASTPAPDAVHVVNGVQIVGAPPVGVS